MRYLICLACLVLMSCTNNDPEPKATPEPPKNNEPDKNNVQPKTGLQLVDKDGEVLDAVFTIAGYTKLTPDYDEDWGSLTQTTDNVCAWMYGWQGKALAVPMPIYIRSGQLCQELVPPLQDEVYYSTDQCTTEKVARPGAMGKVNNVVLASWGKPTDVGLFSAWRRNANNDCVAASLGGQSKSLWELQAVPSKLWDTFTPGAPYKWRVE